MYTVPLIADITEQTRRQVRTAIKNGALVAIKNGRTYEITQNALNDYMNNFLYSENRYKSKSNKKIMADTEIQFLNDFLTQTKECKTLEDLIVKFASANIKIPTMEMFKRFQTHQNILSDRKKGLSYAEIQKEHGVSSRTVYEVITKAKEIKA